MVSPPYDKSFIPLESNPEVFTNLIHRLGVSEKLEFQDVFSLDEPEFLPHPALALILVFPTSEAYEQQKATTERGREEYAGCGDGEEVVWFKQTIHNACGLYGILHAVTNGAARDFIKPSSTLHTVLTKSIPLPPKGRALILENSAELEAAHAAAASQGDTSAPEDAEAEVYHHYVSFVKSAKNGHLYELDGDTKGPIDRGPVLGPEEDVLGQGGIAVVREYIEREKGGDLGFNLLALVES